MTGREAPRNARACLAYQPWVNSTNVTTPILLLVDSITAEARWVGSNRSVCGSIVATAEA